MSLHLPPILKWFDVKNRAVETACEKMYGMDCRKESPYRTAYLSITEKQINSISCNKNKSADMFQCRVSYEKIAAPETELSTGGKVVAMVGGGLLVAGGTAIIQPEMAVTGLVIFLAACSSGDTVGEPNFSQPGVDIANFEVVVPVDTMPTDNKPTTPKVGVDTLFNIPRLDTQLPDILHLDTPLPDTPQQEVTLLDLLADTSGPEVIPCGTNTCNAQTEICCVDVISGKEPVCIDAQDTCEGVMVTCDGPEDCAATAVCCAEVTFEIGVINGKKELSGDTECTPSCNFSFDFNPLTGQGKVTARACHDLEDCTTTEPVCCNTPGIDAGMCLTESAAALAEEYTYGLMDCK